MPCSEENLKLRTKGIGEEALKEQLIYIYIYAKSATTRVLPQAIRR
jgi:hypothetical protein